MRESEHKREHTPEEGGNLIEIQLNMPLRPEFEVFSPPEPPPPRPRRRRERTAGTAIPFWVIIPALAALVLVLAVVMLINPFGTQDEAEDPGVSNLPEWVTVDLLPENPYSRPGTLLERVNGVVIHYVGNPNTSAKANHGYFASLAETGDTYASSHFLVGLEGEVLLNVPLDEIAYCSNRRNDDTISIECCHPDDTGEFTEETYQSLLELTRWLMETYRLDTDQIIRHYDVTGKECPRFFVQNPDAWENFLAELAEKS